MWASNLTQIAQNGKRQFDAWLGEGDGPILLRGLRKIGTVPDHFFGR